MAYGKPQLKDGIADFLAAYSDRNNGFTVEHMQSIMSLQLSDLRKAQRIREEAGHKTLNTAKRWIAQWKQEHDA